MGQKQSLLFAAEKGDFRDSLADLDAFSLYNTFALLIVLIQTAVITTLSSYQLKTSIF